MTKIVLEIKSCKDCPFFEKRNAHSTDGWDRMEDWHCKKADKKIQSSVEWHEERKIEIPDWCPASIKGELRKAFEDGGENMNYDDIYGWSTDESFEDWYDRNNPKPTKEEIKEEVKVGEKSTTFFDDHDNWKLQFSCMNCGEHGQESFTYLNTYANGEEWKCDKCDDRIMVDEEPNIDEY